MTTLPERDTGSVLGAQIDALSWDAALARLLGWARARESRYVTICNVHVVVSASRDAAYREIINGSDMATPDGAPVAWMLRKLGFANQPRVSGPDLMWALCGSVAREYLPVYCYGGCAGEHCHGDWPPGACRVGSGLIFQGEGKAQDSRFKIQAVGW